ncbi:MAG: hypothetical protein ACYTE5_08790 [Planctomycetota bacterium]
METTVNNGRRTRVATIPQYAALKGVSVDKVVGWVKRNRITALRHDGKTVIDVDASERDKQPEEATVEESQLLSPEVLLQRLLVQAEASAQKSYVAQKRWQLVSFVSLLLFIGALSIVMWLYMDVRALTWEQDRLRMDKHTLTENLNLANARLSDLGQKLNQQRSRADQFAVDNISFRNQNKLLSDEVQVSGLAVAPLHSGIFKDEPVRLAEPQINRSQTEAKVQDQSRVNSIRKGIYPDDMTRAELTASLGEPDRIYKDGQYEQLVYFERTPGRFWFRNGPFVQAAN